MATELRNCLVDATLDITGGQHTESSLRPLLVMNRFEELKERVKPDQAADYSPNPSTARAV
jgi:hypothetical protein